MAGEITPVKCCVLWLMFASPILFCMGGCQWRPDAQPRTQTAIEPAPRWVITEVRSPIPAVPTPDELPATKPAACPQCTPADVDAVFDTLVPRQPIRFDEPTKSKPSVSEGGTATGGVRPHSVSPPVVLDERPQRRGVLRGGLFGRRGGG